MVGCPAAGKARARGNIGTLRSGALRVRAYAGIDPVTKKRHDLDEIVPPGPIARREAERSSTGSSTRSPRSGTPARRRRWTSC